MLTASIKQHSVTNGLEALGAAVNGAAQGQFNGHTHTQAGRRHPPPLPHGTWPKQPLGNTTLKATNPVNDHQPRQSLKRALSGGLAIRAFGQCPVGRSVGVKSGPLVWAKITTE